MFKKMLLVIATLLSLALSGFSQMQKIEIGDTVVVWGLDMVRDPYAYNDIPVVSPFVGIVIDAYSSNYIILYLREFSLGDDKWKETRWASIPITTAEMCKYRDYKNKDALKPFLPKLTKKDIAAIYETKKERAAELERLAEIRRAAESKKAEEDKLAAEKAKEAEKTVTKVEEDQVVFSSKTVTITKYNASNSEGYITKSKDVFGKLGYSVFGRSMDPPYVFYEYHSTQDINTGKETDELANACLILPESYSLGQIFILKLVPTNRSGPKISDAGDFLTLKLLAKFLKVRPQGATKFYSPMGSSIDQEYGCVRVFFPPTANANLVGRNIVDVGYCSSLKGDRKTVSFSAYVAQK